MMSSLFIPLLAITLVAAILSRLQIPFAAQLAAISGALLTFMLMCFVLMALLYFGVVRLPRWVWDSGMLRWVIFGIAALPAAIVYVAARKQNSVAS